MRPILGAIVIAAMAVAESASAQGSEPKLKLQDLPPAVQQAIRTESRGATLRGIFKEVTNGVTLYEAELRADGRTKDITFDAQGRIVTLEEQTTLKDIPAAARAAIEKAVGTGTLLLVERVTRGETTFYEGHIRRGGTVSEVKVDAGGKPVE